MYCYDITPLYLNSHRTLGLLDNFIIVPAVQEIQNYLLVTMCLDSQVTCFNSINIIHCIYN